MVGLPARGRAFVAKEIERGLMWAGFPTRVFNVNSYLQGALNRSKEEMENEEIELARLDSGRVSISLFLIYMTDNTVRSLELK